AVLALGGDEGLEAAFRFRAAEPRSIVRDRAAKLRFAQVQRQTDRPSSGPTGSLAGFDALYRVAQDVEQDLLELDLRHRDATRFRHYVRIQADGGLFHIVCEMEDRPLNRTSKIGWLAFRR